MTEPSKEGLQNDPGEQWTGMDEDLWNKFIQAVNDRFAPCRGFREARDRELQRGLPEQARPNDFVGSGRLCWNCFHKIAGKTSESARLKALEVLMRSAGDEAYELSYQDSDMEKPRTCLQRKSDKCGICEATQMKNLDVLDMLRT